jgi:kynurenine--oxoglutarate transaminase/cysteine-S-conjugate beta-lyase/glutamine--phenylpyruvate transaminase
LELIADLCKKHDVLCISDEVYEWLVFDGQEHIRIASLPGMWERTVTIGSGGKTFSTTGWKLGWTIGPADLIKCGHDVFVQTTYTCPTPIQVSQLFSVTPHYVYIRPALLFNTSVHSDTWMF